ncbi:PorP/SprF family type IX secretion system membrane protein [Pontibacter harenae]|uniref:PorP/SprF family type IX secretion system membrane protein n=1 Tax=Pontibacter harenae TaxID=2894083 RepID=UPI001E5303F9|nr:type IX secretion system membrane protein PorP/SprF [Pontibacter harenae]MCC9166774.1 type IX secretion system membrane protein PorP/SprF [Pontibacter harenae]
MKKLLALAITLISASQVFAQQKPQYSQYTLNNYLLNPAITGIEDYADLKFGMRHQWSGLEGAPKSYYATMHMPIMKEITPTYRGRRTGTVAKEASTKRPNVHRRLRPHHGIGAMAMSTQTGTLKRSSFSMSYAYHLPVSKTTRLSAGVSPGFIQYRLDPTSVRVVQGNDPALSDGRVNETKFDLNMGLWLYSREFYIGVAGAQLVPSKRDLITIRNTVGDNTGALQKHYYATAGYRLDLAPGFALVPSVMVKMAEPSPASVDATVKAIYSDRVWAGASYRHKESVTAMAGINLSPLMDVAYSYDASTSPLGMVSAGSHEVVVGFKLINANKVICPQWAW